MTRTDILKQYLAQLAADVAADGKFVGAGSDRAEAAARAILGGAAGMIEALGADVKRVAGDRGSFAASAVAGITSRAADRAVRVGIGKVAEAITTALDKGRREKRATGKAFMAAAKRMGR